MSYKPYIIPFKGIRHMKQILKKLDIASNRKRSGFYYGLVGIFELNGLLSGSNKHGYYVDNLQLLINRQFIAITTDVGLDSMIRAIKSKRIYQYPLDKSDMNKIEPILTDFVKKEVERVNSKE